MQQQMSVNEHSKQLQIHAFLWFFGNTTLNNSLHRSIYAVGSIALASQIEALLDIHIYCALPVSTELHHLLGWNQARLFSC
jgi:hypothetical protein